MSMIPGDEMRSRLAHMHHREGDGKLRPRDHPLRAPLVIDVHNKSDVARLHNSGGAGMFATAQEYCSMFLAHFLSLYYIGWQALRPSFSAQRSTLIYSGGDDIQQKKEEKKKKKQKH